MFYRKNVRGYIDKRIARFPPCRGLPCPKFKPLIGLQRHQGTSLAQPRASYAGFSSVFLGKPADMASACGFGPTLPRLLSYYRRLKSLYLSVAVFMRL